MRQFTFNKGTVGRRGGVEEAVYAGTSMESVITSHQYSSEFDRPFLHFSLRMNSLDIHTHALRLSAPPLLTHSYNLAVSPEELIGCCGILHTQRVWPITNSAVPVGTVCVSMGMTTVTCLSYLSLPLMVSPGQMTCHYVTLPDSASSLTSSSPPSCSLWASKPNTPAYCAAGLKFLLFLPVSVGGVFGVPLNSLLENDSKKFPGVKVPVIFQKLLCILEQTGLHTEGILRVPGSAARLKYLRRELDRCVGGFDWSAVQQVDAAGLLKLFIRELPIPLLTHTHLSTYRSVLGISSVVHQVQALQLLTLLLPEAHRETLRALLVFLRKVVSHQDQNRMSLWNVSIVMAPNLFTWRHRGNKRSVTRQREEMEEAVGGAHLIQLMITHQDLLWTVPTFLLSQVRQLNQVSNQKQFSLKTKKLLRRKDKNQITELCEGLIRVHAPLHPKVSMAIQLDGQMRAKDVTSRFECENSPVLHLYEVGGNICERRLHPDCVLLDTYRVNPRCDWLVKP
uniref:rho GTPase-activating protein 28 isoform X3 n=1 Tax=Monopterus albus TaxID=43700 RepID=UPI0009B2E9C3|nr:rho GTPase-activating protein 18-like isoform X3 [Monopterus albus]